MFSYCLASGLSVGETKWKAIAPGDQCLRRASDSRSSVHQRIYGSSPAAALFSASGSFSLFLGVLVSVSASPPSPFKVP